MIPTVNQVARGVVITLITMALINNFAPPQLKRLVGSGA